MRNATESDISYIAEAMTKIAANIEADDPYVQGLADQAGERERAFVAEHIGQPGSIVLIEESDGAIAGCLLGHIAETSFPPAGLGDVGHVSLVWVEPQLRGQGIAKRLVDHAQSAFREAGVELMELSWLASNTSAAQVWQRLGFVPFRTFAYKSVLGK